MSKVYAKAFAFIAATCFGAPLIGQSGCGSIADNTRRLACFDSLSNVPHKPSTYHVKVTQKYDRFENHTTVIVDGIRPSAFGENMNIAALYVMEGTKPSLPDIVALSLRSVARNWLYRHCHSLHLIADGTRLRLPETTHKGSVLDAGTVSEMVNVFLPRRDFLKIAYASKIEGKLCNTEFELVDDDIAALRAFVSRMNPEDKR